jgi:hypothetical protein
MTNLTIAQAREILNFISDNDTTKEVLKDNAQDFAAFLKIKKSINQNYCTFEHIADSRTLEDEDYFYFEEDYSTSMEGNICYMEDMYFCEYFEEYTEEETSLCYIGRREHRYSDKAICKLGLNEYNGDFYDGDAMDNNDLCYCEDDNQIHHLDNLYYHDSDGQYHLSPEEEDDSEDYISGYHDGGYKKREFTKKPKFFIGFEIEKEDKEVKESLYISDFKDNAPLWRKERDGSLDDASGFELISPTYELKVSKIKKDIKENSMLLAHINAKHSKSCGGHINISEVGKTGEELFNNLKGYTPLFHALYYGRVDKNYSKGKSNEKLLSDNEKYQSIKIHDNRVEYRIISAVPDFDTLIWRAQLMDFILNNQTECIKEAFFKLNTTLLPLIKKVYNTPEKLNALIDRVIKYTLQFENVTLTKEVSAAA